MYFLDIVAKFWGDWTWITASTTGSITGSFLGALPFVVMLVPDPLPLLPLVLIFNKLDKWQLSLKYKDRVKDEKRETAIKDLKATFRG